MSHGGGDPVIFRSLSHRSFTYSATNGVLFVSQSRARSCWTDKPIIAECVRMTNLKSKLALGANTPVPIRVNRTTGYLY